MNFFKQHYILGQLLCMLLFSYFAVEGPPAYVLALSLLAVVNALIRILNGVVVRHVQLNVANIHQLLLPLLQTFARSNYLSVLKAVP